MDLVMKTHYEIFNQLKRSFYCCKNETATLTQYLSGLNMFEMMASFIRELSYTKLMTRITPYITEWRFGDLSNDFLILTIFSATMVFAWITWCSLSAYIRARNCKVTCDWDEEPNLRPRVGQMAVIKISFLPPDPENVRDLLKQISIRIVLGQEEVVLEKDARDSDGAILIKFRIEKAGKYEVYIWFNGFPICGTPFYKVVEPERMDPNMTRKELTEKNPITLTLGRQRKVNIIPIDQNGHRCSATHDDLLRLSIEIRKLKQVDTDQEVDQTVTNEIIASFDLRHVADKTNNDDVYRVIVLFMKATEVGVYYAKILYNDIPLPFEAFEIISISAHEQKIILQKEFQEWRSTTCATFKAIWTPAGDIIENDGNEVKEKKVIVELSPRFFYFKETLCDGPLMSRLATFRICPFTKVKAVLIEKSLDGDSYSLEIWDKMRNKAEVIKMGGSDARIFIVLIASFSYNDEDTRPNLEKKQASLYRGLRGYYLEQNFPRLSYKILKIRRTDLIDSSLLETKEFTREDWGKPFVVSFFGEQVKPDVQAWLEWSEALLQSFFENNPHGMFCYLGSGSASLLHPNPHRNIRWTLAHYELAGKLVGKYLIETALDFDEGNMKYYANARFTRSFLAQILSIRPTYKHLEIDDPDLYMSTVHPILNQSVTGMSLMFTGPFYDRYGEMHVRELIPNGNSIPVTDSNKISYLNALAEHKLAENVELEVKAFVTGLSLVIPDDWLMNFDENELEIVLCGSSNFMVRDIRLHHLGCGVEWNPSVRRVKEWLWKSLQEMSPVDIGRFLQFTTGSSRLPPGGFAELKPRLKISLSCLYGQLPSANRTLHQLFLTDHPNYQEFVYALTAALRGCDINGKNGI